MKKPRLMPSPHIVVGVAIALAGTAFALPGSGSVDKNDLQRGVVATKALKNGSVTAVKIANGAITSAKLANGAVTAADLAPGSITGAAIGANQVNGTHIDEATLGPVPTATAVPFLKRINARLAFGQDVELAINGEVSLRARCLSGATIDGVPNRDGVQVYARTTVAGSFLQGTDNRLGDANGDGLQDGESLDPPDQIDDSTFAVLTDAAGAPNEQQVNSDNDQGFVVAPDGSYIGLGGDQLLLGIRSLGADCSVIGLAFLDG
jgi:hypothetical protein